MEHAVSCRSLVELHRVQSERLGPRPALRVRRHGLFRDITWEQYRSDALSLRRCLGRGRIAAGRPSGLAGGKPAGMAIRRYGHHDSRRHHRAYSCSPGCTASGVSASRCRSQLALSSSLAQLQKVEQILAVSPAYVALLCSMAQRIRFLPWLAFCREAGRPSLRLSGGTGPA